MLLVTSRNHNGWVVPGGGIETGEEAEHAATRELQEEVRQNLKILALFFIVTAGWSFRNSDWITWSI